MIILPSPHGDKLKALLSNAKLPESDVPRVHEAFERYVDWRDKLLGLNPGVDVCLPESVNLLNSYKRFLELDLIYDSSNDFLYRQKGQLKLDNTVIEEFLPIFITKVWKSELASLNLDFGPNNCFSSVYFTSTISQANKGGGLRIRQKSQDFVISRPLFVKASYRDDFANAIIAKSNLAYVAAECKTNLDKTMFQEAAATALDLKVAIPSAKYFLLCEWLDMTPISSSLTAIDEIIILRKAKRISSNIRSHFAIVEGRKKHRGYFEQYLLAHPFHEDTLRRFANHIKTLTVDTSEDEALEQGHF